MLSSSLKASNAAAAGSAIALRACETQLLPLKLREEDVQEMRAQNRNSMLMLEQLRASAARHVADGEALEDARSLAAAASRRTIALATRGHISYL